MVQEDRLKDVPSLICIERCGVNQVQFLIYGMSDLVLRSVSRQALRVAFESVMVLRILHLVNMKSILEEMLTLFHLYQV